MKIEIAGRSNSFLPESLIFACRWLLYPVNIGLAIALGAYVRRFAQDVFQLLVSQNLSNDELLAAVVDLLDKATITALIIVVIVGGQQIYIRRFQNTDAKNWPQWLDHIDTVNLKVKVGLAFTSVSSVQLLKDFLRAEELSLKQISIHVGLHLTFLLSTLVVAVVWRITHPRTC